MNGMAVSSGAPGAGSVEALGTGVAGVPVEAQAAAPSGRTGMAGTVTILRLFSRPSRGDRWVAALPTASFAVVTALLAVVLGGSQAFFTMDSAEAGLYVTLTVIALAVLVVPMFTLGSAAAKLSARRRDDRLATLRLLGASQRLVTRLTVIDAVRVALVGAVIGSALYAGIAPAVGLLTFGGKPLGSAVWLPLWANPALWGVAGVIAAVSAAVGLRSVVVSPLGVRTRQRPARVRGLRAIVAAVILVVAVLLTSSLAVLGRLGGYWALVAGLGAAFGFALLAIDAVGPWVVRVNASARLRRATSVVDLLAARITLDEPKAVWRQVGGVAVTTFVGVVAGAGLALAHAAGQQHDLYVITDMTTGVLVTLAISFVMVACTVAINQAAATLDRASVLVSLDRLGVPRTVVARAQRRSVMSALTAVVVGSAVVSGVLMLPLIGAAMLLRPISVAVILGVFTAGYLVVRLGASVSARLIPGILAHPARAL